MLVLRDVSENDARLHVHPPRNGRDEAEYGFKEGRLPAAIGAQYAGELSPFDGKLDGAQNCLAVVPYRHVLEFYKLLHFSP